MQIVLVIPVRRSVHVVASVHDGSGHRIVARLGATVARSLIASIDVGVVFIEAVALLLAEEGGGDVCHDDGQVNGEDASEAPQVGVENLEQVFCVVELVNDRTGVARMVLLSEQALIERVVALKATDAVVSVT